ncbi:MAG: hypothetical protein LKM40_00465 [Mageeibacillus sp.]|jgi:hypothetical protein|nr:hypothetical protein [Mageeibacillus sp.]
MKETDISTFYYSYSKAAAEREDLESKIDRIAAYLKKQEGQEVVIDKTYEKYFSLEYYHEGEEDQCFVCGIEKASVIEEELKMCGYFCIITSAEMTAKEALDLYKSRDASEKLFKADKSFLGNRSLRVYTGESLEGKMLIAFVAPDHKEPDVRKAEGCRGGNAGKTELHERTGIYSGTGKNRNGPAGRRCIPVGSCRYRYTEDDPESVRDRCELCKKKVKRDQ